MNARREMRHETFLAVDIADRLREAASGRTISDIETEARALMARHPEAHVSLEDVADTIRHELGFGFRPSAPMQEPSPSL